MKKLIAIMIFINMPCVYSQIETNGTNNQKKLTSNEKLSVCNRLWQTQYASTPGFGYTYQEQLWIISGAIPGVDTVESAKLKIQKMWMQNREDFRCMSFSNSIATDKNVVKFALESGMPGFVIEMVKRFELDMNFIDAGDQKTILDYITDRIATMKRQPPVDQPKIDEYKKIYDLLVKHGAKHASELNK